MFFKKSNRSIAELNGSVSLDLLKRTSRIVVIDDDADSVPIEVLRENGYMVDYWPMLDAAKQARLERGEFDIIVLDIQGIVPEGFSDTGDGRGVLRRLKASNPNQAVIACSGQSYTLDAVDFYRLADAVLAKPITGLRALETIESLIRDRVSVVSYWRGIAQILAQAQVDASRIQKLESSIVVAAQGKQKLDVDRIRGMVGDVGLLLTVGELVEKLLSLARGT